jgi:hypothetical protein
LDEIFDMTKDEFLAPLPITNDDVVYRQAHMTHLKYLPGDKNSRFPKESHFKPDADGLSVNCCRLIPLNGVYHVIGLTYKFNTTHYKDPRQFQVFSLPVEFIRAIENVSDVVHSPVFHGDPAPIGSPNNYAHTSLLYPDDEEIRLKLSDYCQHNHNISFCPVDFSSIDIEVGALRIRLDDTEYHRLPKTGQSLY